MAYGNVVPPPGSRSTSTAWPAISTVWMLLSYALWNQVVSGVPFWRPREAVSSSEGFPQVRSATHATPSLPSVKDLADDLNDFYA